MTTTIQAEYTQGKLVCHSGMIWKPDDSENGIPIARMDREIANGTYPVERDENAKRLTACWNACEGVQDPDKAIPALIEALTWANDALLHRPEGLRSPGEIRAIREARAAIALAQTKGDE